MLTHGVDALSLVTRGFFLKLVRVSGASISFFFCAVRFLGIAQSSPHTPNNQEEHTRHEGSKRVSIGGYDGKSQQECWVLKRVDA